MVGCFPSLNRGWHRLLSGNDRGGHTVGTWPWSSGHELRSKPVGCQGEVLGMEKISGFLVMLQRHGTAFMATGLVVGLALPPLAALLRPALPVFVFLLTVA